MGSDPEELSDSLPGVEKKLEVLLMELHNILQDITKMNLPESIMLLHLKVI